MNQTVLDLKKLPKKDRIKFFKEQQVKNRQKERTKWIIIRSVTALAALGFIVFLGYLVVTSDQGGQTSVSSELTSIGNLKLGDAAPDFSLPSADGRTISLRNYKGKNVLLYFQEGVMCQPCWKQIGSMQKNIDLFNQVETEIVTVGVDSASTWAPILKAEGVNTIPVLIDDDRVVSEAYGVLSMPSQMHQDRPGHTFVLVDKNGKIRWIGDFPTMRVTDQEVANFVRKALKENSTLHNQIHSPA